MILYTIDLGIIVSCTYWSLPKSP